MIKVLVFIRKLPHLTMEEFIRHYEETHVPLINGLLPMYAGYQRNYLSEGLYPEGARRDFDVVTELVFADDAAHASWLAALNDPAIVDQIRADEAHFIDSSATEMWVVRPYGGLQRPRDDVVAIKETLSDSRGPP